MSSAASFYEAKEKLQLDNRHISVTHIAASTYGHVSIQIPNKKTFTEQQCYYVTSILRSCC